MKKKPLLELPYASTSLIHAAMVENDVADRIVPLDFDDEGQKRSYILRFTKVRACRERSEIYCTVWHIDGVYDQVCEIKKSDWVAELKAAAEPDMRHDWVMRHFMIYIDSFGCLEVISESVFLEDVDKTQTNS